MASLTNYAGIEINTCCEGTKPVELPEHLKFVNEIMLKIKQFELSEQNEIIWNIRDQIKGLRKQHIEKLNAEIEQINKSLVDF